MSLRPTGTDSSPSSPDADTLAEQMRCILRGVEHLFAELDWVAAELAEARRLYAEAPTKEHTDRIVIALLQYEAREALLPEYRALHRAMENIGKIEDSAGEGLEASLAEMGQIAKLTASLMAKVAAPLQPSTETRAELPKTLKDMSLAEVLRILPKGSGILSVDTRGDADNAPSER